MTPELANNLRLKAELLEVSRAFDSCGIEHGVLKGVPLVLRLYGQLDARWIGDNDLLIRRGSEIAACQALAELGYRTKRDAVVGLRYDGRATFRRENAETERAEVAIVDLHVEAFDPLLFAVPADLVWAHLEPFDLGGLRVAVLDRELTVLHQAAHCTQHAMMEPRTLRDLARAWNEWGDALDLDGVQSIARQYELLDALMFGLWVAQDLGMLRREPPPWPAPRAAWLRRLLPTRRLLRPPSQGSENRLPYLRMAAMGVLLSNVQQRHFLRMYLFPPAEKMAVTSQGLQLWRQYAARLARPLTKWGRSG